MTTSDERSPVPKRASDVPEWIWAAVGAAVYVALMQIVLLLGELTGEITWLWPLALADGWEQGMVTGFLGSAAWWLAFAFPISVTVLGYVASYSLLETRSLDAAAVALLYLVLFALSEAVLSLGLGVPFVLASPVVAAVAFLLHYSDEDRITEAELPI